MWPRSVRHTAQVLVLSAQARHAMCPLWHWKTSPPAGTVRQTGHCRISSIFALSIVSLASVSSSLRFRESKDSCNQLLHEYFVNNQSTYLHNEMRAK